MMIVCGCVLVLRPFCRRYLPFLLVKTERNRDSPGGMSGLFAKNGSPIDNISIRYDGPMGPRSKSHYRTKVSSIGNKSGSGGSAKNRTLWGIGFGTPSLEEDNDDDLTDLESLSADSHKHLPGGIAGMGVIGSTASNINKNRNTYDKVEADSTLSNSKTSQGRSDHLEMVESKSTFPDQFGGEMDTNGIVKTVSLDVRDRRI